MISAPLGGRLAERPRRAICRRGRLATAASRGKIFGAAKQTQHARPLLAAHRRRRSRKPRPPSARPASRPKPRATSGPLAEERGGRAGRAQGRAPGGVGEPNQQLERRIAVCDFALTTPNRPECSATARAVPSSSVRPVPIVVVRVENPRRTGRLGKADANGRIDLPGLLRVGRRRPGDRQAAPALARTPPGRRRIAGQRVCRPQAWPSSPIAPRPRQTAGGPPSAPSCRGRTAWRSCSNARPYGAARGKKQQTAPAGRRAVRIVPHQSASGQRPVLRQQSGKLLVFRPGLRGPTAKLLQAVRPIVAAEQRRAEGNCQRHIFAPDRLVQPQQFGRRSFHCGSSSTLWGTVASSLRSARGPIEVRRAQTAVGRKGRRAGDSASRRPHDLERRPALGVPFAAPAARPPSPAPDHRPRPGARRLPPRAAGRVASVGARRRGIPPAKREARRLNSRARVAGGAWAWQAVIGLSFRFKFYGEKGTGTICRNGPEGASHKWCLSLFQSVTSSPSLSKPRSV